MLLCHEPATQECPIPDPLDDHSLTQTSTEPLDAKTPASPTAGTADTPYIEVPVDYRMDHWMQDLKYNAAIKVCLPTCCRSELSH